MITGAGVPVTVVAHGLGGSIAETRPLLSGVPGTKVYYEARGHGSARRPVAPGYGELADDLLQVADCHGATQALGVSLGAHTILRVLAGRPARFDRAVLLLPASVDVGRDPHAVERLTVMRAALESQDLDAMVALVRTELPAGIDAEPYAAARAAYLLSSSGLAPLLDALADDPPVPDRAVLAAVRSDVLVLAQEGDPLHPVAAAEQLAGLIPGARLEVLPAGMVFRHRARLRELIVTHLSSTASS
ncbi:MAG: alpha/beta hydrolase [Frankiales bacterium]|nr:alpha/beta hydrolase [Frankiales bacterium]